MFLLTRRLRLYFQEFELFLEVQHQQLILEETSFPAFDLVEGLTCSVKINGLFACLIPVSVDSTAVFTTWSCLHVYLPSSSALVQQLKLSHLEQSRQTGTSASHQKWIFYGLGIMDHLSEEFDQVAPRENRGANQDFSTTGVQKFCFRFCYRFCYRFSNRFRSGIHRDKDSVQQLFQQLIGMVWLCFDFQHTGGLSS
ncbi:hypothetical protein JOB18_014261 [Solea senegalensis]|uniref:Uncharacterized protein n=1 Tax=Solea senegalensis TaxID=28829 RepID=A0AAV6SAP2_SOLSE|nr:hypothetical protein JOB18_014261 [Solea senegalensis]